jgi:chorismate mutase
VIILNYEKEIAPHRQNIDRLNVEIISKIKERVDVAIEIGIIKKKHGKPIKDIERERQILNKVRKISNAYEINPDVIERIFREIIQLCVDIEEKNL